MHYYMTFNASNCKSYSVSVVAVAYQKYCAPFDKSTKIGTLVDNHLINIFGCGGAHKCTHGSHSNTL